MVEAAGNLRCTMKVGHSALSLTFSGPSSLSGGNPALLASSDANSGAGSAATALERVGISKQRNRCFPSTLKRYEALFVYKLVKFVL